MRETGRAFDDHRPPELALLKDCVHCGFCLPTCPTYELWGEEMDSPRGRIALMLQGLEPASELSEQMVTHFDRCLGCMACVTACPSGVAYDRLIEAVRPQVERNHPRPRSERLLRQALFALLTHPGRLRALLPLLAGYRRSGLAAALERSRSFQRFPKLRATATLAPEVRLRAGLRRLAPFTPARGERRARVGLLQGCVQRVFFPHVNETTVSVLAAEGCEVIAPARPRCCGALMLHAGYEPEALALARVTIAGFEGCDFVVVNAAGCGSAMKSYADLLADDPEWGPRAAAFCAKVRDVSELLVDLGPVAERHPVALRVAYHDSCHLAHAQGVRTQPRALLETIPGLTLAEPREWEICCGSAGIYNLLQPAPAEELGRRKAKNLIATGADAVVAGNPGCTLQIAAHLRALGHPLPVYHPAELLAASIVGHRL